MIPLPENLCYNTKIATKTFLADHFARALTKRRFVICFEKSNMKKICL